MSTGTKTFTTITLEDGTFAVVQADPRKPQLLEVIAIFSDAARARDYADRENSRSAEPASEPKKAPPRPASAPPPAAPAELSARQSAVLKALRSKMDEHKQIAAKVADLAKAAQIPLGSLHSVLQSLEKKQLIKSVRAGSARTPAAYQVL